MTESGNTPEATKDNQEAEAPPAPAPDTVTLTIDGKSVTVPKGTAVIEAAKEVGIHISAFCYHPGLSLAACCRQCLVTIEKSPKLQPSCQAIAQDGMVVETEDSRSKLARKSLLEFTLLNHPVDCPICDKAGECTLQKHYFDHDNEASRVDVPKVRKPKVVDLGPHIVLDAERCILCTRCIRVCDEVAGVHQLEMRNRGDREELGTAPGAVLDNPYSMNTVDVCPVGALTAKDFRFKMRAWELMSTPSTCMGCATGCNIEVHHRDDQVYRIIPRENLEVNQYWMCDEGRFIYHDLSEKRLAVPLIDGLPASWEDAVAEAKNLLDGDSSKTAVLLSAGQSNEDNFALLQLAQKLGIENLYMASSPAQPDRADGKLMDSDVDPNRRGVQTLAPGAKSLDELSAGLKSGAIECVVALGAPNLGEEGQPLSIGKVVTFATHETGLATQSHVALPISAWAEIDGTVTNKNGLTQRLHSVVASPGHAIPGWKAIGLLSEALGQELAFGSAKDVFAKFADQLEGANWGRPVMTKQLRFAGSRG